jgi:hypothetical protein
MAGRQWMGDVSGSSSCGQHDMQKHCSPMIPIIGGRFVVSPTGGGLYGLRCMEIRW